MRSGRLVGAGGHVIYESVRKKRGDGDDIDMGIEAVAEEGIVGGRCCFVSLADQVGVVQRGGG